MNAVDVIFKYVNLTFGVAVVFSYFFFGFGGSSGVVAVVVHTSFCFCAPYK